MRYLLFSILLSLLILGCGDSKDSGAKKASDGSVELVSDALNRKDTPASGGKTSDGSVEIAPPSEGITDSSGGMKVVSVEPIQAPLPPSVLPNGDFNDWPEGEPAPAGFQPPNLDFSYVEGIPKNEGGFSIKQTWTANDFSKPSEWRFGILMDVMPNTEYQLEISASNLEGGGVEIILMTETPQGKRTLIDNHFLTFSEASPQEKSSRVLKTADSPKLLIIAGLVKDGKVPSSIVWNHWILRPVEQ